MVVRNMQINALSKKTTELFGCARCLIIFVLLIGGVPALQAGVTAPIVMVFGDSLVAGHGLTHDKAFPNILRQGLAAEGFNVEMINAGVSGDTTAAGWARLEWSLVRAPDAVIVILGGNDLLRGLDPNESYTNLSAIITTLKNRGIKVLLAGMQAPRNLGAEYADEFNSIYPRLANEHDVLLYPFFLDGVALMVDLNQADGMHPNLDGVTLISKKIMPAVKELLAQLSP